jgi:acetyltransferase-like isoleucine patch superfamily enzyme
MSLVKTAIRAIALRTGKFRWLYVKLCRPNSYEYADFLRVQGRFFHIGARSRINPGAVITDPHFTRIGDNCAVAACHLIGHNGAAGVLSQTYAKKLDSVGKIDIRDNSFVGHAAIVLPDVVIGPNSIVAAGSVVARDVPPGVVVGGVPAKVICTTDEYAERLDERTKSYPWAHLIEQRDGDWDAALEPELRVLRLRHFFGSEHGHACSE